MNPKWMDLYNGLKGFILKEIPCFAWDEGSEGKLPDPSYRSKNTSETTKRLLNKLQEKLRDFVGRSNNWFEQPKGFLGFFE